MPGYIYTLSDPRTQKIRYVGQTTNLDSRYKQHCDKIKGHPKDLWVKELKQENLLPIMTILEHVDKTQDLSYREKWWIAIGQAHGWELLNVADPTRKDVSFEDVFSSSLKKHFDEFENENRPIAVLNAKHIKAITAAALMLLIVIVEVNLSALLIAKGAQLITFWWIGSTLITSAIAIWLYVYEKTRWAISYPILFLSISLTIIILNWK